MSLRRGDWADPDVPVTRHGNCCSKKKIRKSVNFSFTKEFLIEEIFTRQLGMEFEDCKVTAVSDFPLINMVRSSRDKITFVAPLDI